MVVYQTPAETIPAAGYGLSFFYHVVETETAVFLAVIPVAITVAATTIAVTLLSSYYSFPASVAMAATMVVASSAK